MEKSNFLYESGDILFIETRPNERGSFYIVYLRLLLSGGISVSSRVRLSIRTIENGVIESDAGMSLKQYRAVIKPRGIKRITIFSVDRIFIPI